MMYMYHPAYDKVKVGRVQGSGRRGAVRPERRHPMIDHVCLWGTFPTCRTGALMSVVRGRETEKRTWQSCLTTAVGGRADMPIERGDFR
jgi:hypothetical protein